MRDDDRQLRRDCKDVAQRPRFEEVKRDIDMRVQQRLERDEALLDLLCAIPVFVDLVLAFGGPAAQEHLHRVDSLADCIVGGVDNVVEKKLRHETEDFGEKDGRYGVGGRSSHAA